MELVLAHLTHVQCISNGYNAVVRSFADIADLAPVKIPYSQTATYMVVQVHTTRHVSTTCTLWFVDMYTETETVKTPAFAMLCVAGNYFQYRWNG